MAHSGKEAVAMRCTKCVFLLLLLGLSVLLAGCEFRDILDDYPVSGVQIKLDSVSYKHLTLPTSDLV